MTESYQFILKTLRNRLPSALSDQAELNNLSMSELLNLIFVLYGTWGSVGDFSTTFKALRKIVGEEQLWKEPAALQPTSELVQWCGIIVIVKPRREHCHACIGGTFMRWYVLTPEDVRWLRERGIEPEVASIEDYIKRRS
jgi:hypothetical protein